MKQKNGFTLIEILVVIAIISILVVISLPSLLKNIEKARISDLEADISAMKYTISANYLDKSSMIGSKNWLMIYKDHDGNIKYSPEFTDEAAEEIKYIRSAIENLSIPFGYYIIESKESNTFLTILFDENEFVKAPKISSDGIKKLENDFGNRIEYIEEEQRIVIKLT